MFSTLLKANFNVLVTFISSTANAFTLDQDKICRQKSKGHIGHTYILNTNAKWKYHTCATI